MNPQRVVVDVETSGMAPAGDRVLSVAAVLLDEHGQPADRFSTLLNPGVDPGPTHVHGLTPALLAGAPRFNDIAAELDTFLDGRIVVAHNAAFDVSFLLSEARHAHHELPLTQWLCTVEYAGRLHLPTPALTLAALAQHFGVHQDSAHQALDDALVLSGVLRGLDGVARQRQVEPIVRDVADMIPDATTGMLRPAQWMHAIDTPRVWRPAGRFRQSGALVQGMEVVLAPEIDQDPIELATEIVAAGLYVAGRLTSRTSLVVCDDPRREGGRAGFARRRGLTVISSTQLRQLLTAVQPGQASAAHPNSDAGQGSLFELS